MLPIKIAWRFIIKSPIQNIMTILTIVIGIGIQFFILSISDTLSNIILDHTTSYNEHILIINRLESTIPLEADQNLKEQILADIPEIELFNYMLSISTVTLSTDNLPPIKFIVRAVDDEKGFDFYGLTQAKHLTSGSFPTEPNQILLTKQFAEQYMISDNEWITLNYSPMFGVPVSIQYQVTGTFDLGLFRQSHAYTIILASTLPDGYQYESNYGVAQLKDPRKADEVAEQLKSYFDLDNFEVQTWKDYAPEIYMLDTAQVLVITLIQVFLSIAILIVVASIIGFSIHQKSKQLGILKAMGLKDHDVSLVFFLQSLVLGFVGTILGLIGGTIFLRLYQDYMVYEDGTPRIIFHYNLDNYLLAVLTVLITVILASFFTMNRAKRVYIIELIKT